MLLYITNISEKSEETIFEDLPRTLHKTFSPVGSHHESHVMLSYASVKLKKKADYIKLEITMRVTNRDDQFLKLFCRVSAIGHGFNVALVRLAQYYKQVLELPRAKRKFRGNC